jgi:fructose-bisphosphate aldolase class II
MKTLIQIIKEAEKKRVAIGHFNVANLEQLKAVTESARKLGLPVIIGVSEGERKYIGVHEIVDIVKDLRNDGFDIFLNADHTHSLEKAKEAAEAGFDSIVFDGSSLTVEENIKMTREAVKIVKTIKPDMIVEGELGYIGSGSEILKELPKGVAISSENYTKPEDASRFVSDTSVDMFSPAVGNLHGMFLNTPNPALDISRIRAIKTLVKVPLVLHGGSGISDDDFTKAIEAGISIIHISTELRLAWRQGMEKGLKDNPDEVAPYKITPVAIAAMEKVVEARLKLFGRMK